LSETWQQSAEAQLGQIITEKRPLSGGDFATAYSATLASGQQIFVKTHKSPPPFFFSTEATGLKWLRESGCVNTPQVLAVSDDPPYLALEWVSAGRATAKTEVQLGAALAELHRSRWSQFGRPDKMTTGSLGVPNNKCDSWAQFYATQRLLPLADIAEQREALTQNDCKMLRWVAERLDQLEVPDELPSLLHGDLWAGNRVVDTNGASWLIDPAVHGGHREFDLAMMQLFGGYERDCFSSYHEVYPLEPGYQARVPLHQLAPLVVHAIKFGGSYKSAVREALNACKKLI